ncbi:thioredoxin domain-containing protein [uncultured Desulfobulbus sp.]|uniref:thioredoxin family protein n=1 Tax=uncultured Desulfobulbus sp. TaxID=239745 RepID=UPI0029C837B1|nr:thioredoxin domain-containing protein [uncultured Desulfobulbus sp.]
MQNAVFEHNERGVRSSCIRDLFPVFVVLTALSLLLTTSASRVRAEQLPQVPVPGMVTMVDLGAEKCIPCKMMAPIIEELVKEYQGRAAVLFIDVWENPDAAPKFGVRAIPTQIFYDAQGKEISRHEGFMDKASIVAVFQQQGVK